MMKKYLLQLLLPLCFAFLAKQTAFAQYESNTIISTNNISALISNTGNHFLNGERLAQYNVPKEGNASTVFTNNLWIGGTDSAGNLRLAAGLYGQTGTDYYTGPLSTKDASINEAVMQKWNRFFRVTKQEILDFLNPERDPSDIPISLLEWPAHGDTSKGQAFYLAPYKDVNGDGVYNPHDGDYPVIKGDETVFFIFNDNFFIMFYMFNLFI
jgi:hypothetical protein